MKPATVLLLILIVAAWSIEATAQDAIPPARKDVLRENPEQIQKRHIIGRPGDIKIGGSFFEPGVPRDDNNTPQPLKTADQPRATRTAIRQQTLFQQTRYDWGGRRIIGKPGDIELGGFLFGDAATDALLGLDPNNVEARLDSESPEGYGLKGYPNPFNPTTTLTFELPARSAVRLVVYDVLGRQVSVLAEGVYEAGRHQAPFEGAHLPSGIYLVRLTTPDGNFTSMMILAK